MKAVVRKLFARLTGDQRGATAVEFALALPLYLLFTFIFIETCRLVYTQAAVMFAAEEATRYATVHYDATVEDLKTVAAGRVFGLDKAKISSIDVSSVLDPGDQTKRVTVAVAYSHDLLIPFTSGGIVTLEGASRGFLVEQ